MKSFKKFVLLLLIVTGAQSARAWVNNHADVQVLPIGKVTYELCHVYTMNATVNSKLSTMVDPVSSLGYTESNSTSLGAVNEYYASVVEIIGSAVNLEIPDSITNGGRTYPVKYFGLHTEQTVTSRDSTFTWYQWLGSVGGTMTTTCYYYSYTQTIVDISNSNIFGKLTMKGNVDFKGGANFPSCTSVEFQGSVTFNNDVSFSNATEITFNGNTTINNTLLCPQVSELRFQHLGHYGKINGGGTGKLKDIYYLSNIPSYSNSYANYFTGITPGNITIHVAGKTYDECQTMHDSWAVYSSFKDVVPYDISGDGFKTLTVSIQCTYPEYAPVNLQDVYFKYNDERIYGGETRTYQLQEGTFVDLLPTLYYPPEYGIDWIGNIYVNGVKRTSSGPFRVQMTNDITVVWEAAPTNHFVRVTNVSPVGSRSLYWTDPYNNTHEIAPQTWFLVPVRRNSSGVTVYALTEDQDIYEPKGYWYNGIDYMDSTDVSKGAMYYNGGQLWQGEEYCMEFVLQPTADPQDRIVLLGLNDDVPTSEYLKINVANGAGGRMWLSCEYNESNMVMSVLPATNGPLTTLTKANMGNSVTLKLLPLKGRTLKSLYFNGVYKSNPITSGDTLIYNLGNLAANYDEVSINAIYKDSYDYTKRRVRFLSKDQDVMVYTTGRNTPFYPGRLAAGTFRQYNVGDTYQVSFISEKEPMKVSVNGENLTDSLTTENGRYYLPERTLTNFDECVILEFNNDESLMAVSLADGFPSVQIATTFADGNSGLDTFTNPYISQYIPKNSGNSYRLRVPLDDGLPVRVLRNGVDVTYEFNDYDSNNGYLCYNMNVSEDALWEVSYDTSHRQTFIVKGGTTEQVVEMEYEHLYGGPVLHANNNGIPASAYLPPFDNEYNSYVYLTFYVKEGETATIFRNGVDVTDKFERGGTYYDLQINDADYDNNNTLSALGFDIREPATWEITIDDLYSVHHEVTLVGSENNNVTFDYQDANGDHEDAFSSKHGIFKTPPYDYNSYNTFMLDVDVKTGEKLHVFCNGEEVTEGLVLIGTDTDGTKTYEFYADDPETNYIMAELDINVFEGCSWVILIDDGSGKFDVNGDGEINVTDVTALVNKILHP